MGLLVWAVAWYEGEVHAGPPGRTAIVTVAQGSALGSITSTLASDAVVGSGLAFRIYLALHGAPLVDSGAYAFRRNEAFSEVRATLAGGPDVVYVPAGLTVGETATRVGQIRGHDASAFASLVTSGVVVSRFEPAGSGNLDGLLGTGYYIVGRGESDTELLVQMVDRFDAQASAAGLVPMAASLGITPYQAVTVASIVEKEGVYQQNLGKVARVVYNRLARNMPLQMDSTVLYSEHRDGGPVTATDLALDTPYNTYLHRGLPPTPICFPSPASLAAALAPPPGDWLYFVLVSRDGTEAFSDTLSGQLANEQLARSRGLG
ncbi:MAG: endolytic transglycosylase MltG [Acidimicrobiales bacterium]